MKTRLAMTVLTATGLAVGSAAPAAWGSFVEQASASASFSAAVLAPPTNVATSTPTCLATGYSSQLAWTASASTWLDGYEVAMGTLSGGPYTVVARPTGVSPTATSRTLSGLARRTTYYVVVRTTRSSWRAESAQVTVTTPAKNC